jgi:hypothetical protein
MKLPKWLVVILLSASFLSTIVALGRWWVTWPERTMEEFVALGAAGRLDEASAMVVFEPEIGGVVNVQHLAALCGSALAKRRSRTTGDVVLGVEWYFDSDSSRGLWKSYLPGEEEKVEPYTRIAIYVQSVRAQRGKIVFGLGEYGTF